MPVTMGDEVAVAVVGDVLIELWRGPATTPRWRWMMAQREALAAKNAQGFVDLSLILSTSSPPDAALRSQMQKDFRSLGTSMRRMVVVPLGDSLWLALVRAIVRGILLVSGQSKVQFVASNTREGFDRVLEAASPQTPTRAQLGDAVIELTKALGANPSETTASL
jgi:hypothetical protein